ncbi:MlaE family ABC transporter permease [Uliginosibacterium sp. H1]|uniref:MlaE family ABC transporter permease n=1 Tax=Uliginosibacterium sp. H1 TaxID=3114757 RepID=UPI002E178FF3|nr:ABC transporter permease [Uliginosibacterium sp. H1]
MQTDPATTGSTHRKTPGIERHADRWVLRGDWTLQSLCPRLKWIRSQLRSANPDAAWDLSDVGRLDSFGALLLWKAWGLREPAELVLAAGLQTAFDRIRAEADVPPPVRQLDLLAPVARLGDKILRGGYAIQHFVAMVGQVVIEAARLLQNPARTPLREVSATLYKAGITALPIAAMLGFLIGLVLAYLMAFQLRNFGADVFIVNLLGIGIIREIGPVLVSVLVAGRSGSAFTAQIGVMRVTEEIDALSAMGVSRHQRLILPKLVAMVIAMPLLVLWTSVAALLGGALVAQLQLDIDMGFFAETLQRVVPVENLYIGLVKGSLFGAAIALVSCHYGLRVQPNTESLSANTTKSVVVAISAVILLNALFAVATRGMGMPGR